MGLNSWNGLTPTLKPLRYGNFPLLTFFDEFGFSGTPPRQFRIVNGELIWRVENQDELPASAQLINSPYDLEARFSRKHAHTWVGYKVHLSEICDESQPHRPGDPVDYPSSYGDQYLL